MGMIFSLPLMHPHKCTLSFHHTRSPCCIRRCWLSWCIILGTRSNKFYVESAITAVWYRKSFRMNCWSDQNWQNHHRRKLCISSRNWWTKCQTFKCRIPTHSGAECTKAFPLSYRHHQTLRMQSIVDQMTMHRWITEQLPTSWYLQQKISFWHLLSAACGNVVRGQISSVGPVVKCSVLIKTSVV